MIPAQRLVSPCRPGRSTSPPGSGSRPSSPVLRHERETPVTRFPLIRAALVAVFAAGCASATGAISTQAPAPPVAHPASAIVATIPLDVKVDAIVVGPEGVWLRSPNGTVLAVDPATNRVASRINVPPSEFGGVALGSGSVWVTDFAHDRIYRIDPKSKTVAATIAVGKSPQAMLATSGAIWVTNFDGGSISKVDTASGTVAATFSFATEAASDAIGVALVAGDLWTSIQETNYVLRLSPINGTVVAKLNLSGPFLG